MRSGEDFSLFFLSFFFLPLPLHCSQSPSFRSLECRPYFLLVLKRLFGLLPWSVLPSRRETSQKEGNDLTRKQKNFTGSEDKNKLGTKPEAQRILHSGSTPSFPLTYWERGNVSLSSSSSCLSRRSPQCTCTSRARTSDKPHLSISPNGPIHSLSILSLSHFVCVLPISSSYSETSSVSPASIQHCLLCSLGRLILGFPVLLSSPRSPSLLSGPSLVASGSLGASMFALKCEERNSPVRPRHAWSHSSAPESDLSVEKLGGESKHAREREWAREVRLRGVVVCKPLCFSELRASFFFLRPEKRSLTTKTMYAVLLIRE